PSTDLATWLFGRTIVILTGLVPTSSEHCWTAEERRTIPLGSRFAEPSSTRISPLSPATGTISLWFGRIIAVAFCPTSTAGWSWTTGRSRRETEFPSVRRRIVRTMRRLHLTEHNIWWPGRTGAPVRPTFTPQPCALT